MSNLFAFGLGYSAQELADRLLGDGWTVAGTCRTAEKAERLKERGIEAHLFDPANDIVPDPAVIGGATHILISVAPGEDGDAVLNHFRDTLASSEATWIGYLSTTGVYGDSGGAWVDETSSTEPSLVRAQRRVAAERAWLDLHADHGQPVHVFRLAGIYGPGRSAIDTIRKGAARRIDRPGQLFGRIHAADIANVLQASIDKPAPGEIYNVSDDEPAAPADVTTYACELLGVEPPPLVPFEEAAKSMSPMGRSFWADNRKVSNRKIHDALGVELTYPTYREGLRGVLDAKED